MLEEYEHHTVCGVGCIVWQWQKSDSLSAADRAKHTKRKQCVGKEHRNIPMLDIRYNNGSLEFCDIIIVLEDMRNSKKALRFHFNTPSDPKKSSSGLKYSITLDSALVGYSLKNPMNA